MEQQLADLERFKTLIGETNFNSLVHTVILNLMVASQSVQHEASIVRAAVHQRLLDAEVVGDDDPLVDTLDMDVAFMER